jgi:hypothetical protein
MGWNARAALMSGRYGTRFGFEFTPTPPGFTPVEGTDKLTISAGQLAIQLLTHCAVIASQVANDRSRNSLKYLLSKECRCRLNRLLTAA